MDVAKAKAKLEGQIQALEILEGLNADQLAAVQEVLAMPTSPDKEQCPQCGELFKPTGIKRHITIAHG